MQLSTATDTGHPDTRTGVSFNPDSSRNAAPTGRTSRDSSHPDTGHPDTGAGIPVHTNAAADALAAWRVARHPSYSRSRHPHTDTWGAVNPRNTGHAGDTGVPLRRLRKLCPAV